MLLSPALAVSLLNPEEALGLALISFPIFLVDSSGNLLGHGLSRQGIF